MKSILEMDDLSEATPEQLEKALKVIQMIETAEKEGIEAAMKLRERFIKETQQKKAAKARRYQNP